MNKFICLEDTEGGELLLIKHISSNSLKPSYIRTQYVVILNDEIKYRDYLEAPARNCYNRLYTKQFKK